MPSQWAVDLPGGIILSQKKISETICKLDNIACLWCHYFGRSELGSLQSDRLQCYAYWPGHYLALRSTRMKQTLRPDYSVAPYLAKSDSERLSDTPLLPRD